MRLRVIETVSDPGAGEVNEDVADHGTSSAWVLDGATSLSKRRLLPGPSDAAWLAAEYSRLLTMSADREDLEPQHLLKQLIAEFAQKFEEKRQGEHEEAYDLPSAGLALARIRGLRLEFARLGDCRVILAVRRAGSQETLVASSRSDLSRLDARAIASLVEAYKAGAPDYPAAKQAIDKVLRENRALMNKPGGYWVLGIVSDAAQHAEYGEIDLGGAIAEGLLVTDGFYRLVDTFGLYPNDAELMAAVRRHGAATLIAQLRRREDDDPKCRDVPRLKPKDDASVVHFEVGASYTAVPAAARDSESGPDSAAK